MISSDPHSGVFLCRWKVGHRNHKQATDLANYILRVASAGDDPLVLATNNIRVERHREVSVSCVFSCLVSGSHSVCCRIWRSPCPVPQNVSLFTANSLRNLWPAIYTTKKCFCSDFVKCQRFISCEGGDSSLSNVVERVVPCLTPSSTRSISHLSWMLNIEPLKYNRVLRSRASEVKSAS